LTSSQAINVGATACTFTFELPFKTVAKTGTAEVLSGNEKDSNTPSEPNKMIPKKAKIQTGKTFDYMAPAYSVSILMVEAY
jgi:alpha-L-arabinofuranosidase